VRRPAVGDCLAAPLDRVLEAEARTPHVQDARVHEQAVVEPRGLAVANVRLDEERLDPLVAQPLIAPGELLEEVDPRRLEPDEVVRVVGDPLRVGLGEADPDLGCVTELLHCSSLHLRSERQFELRVIHQARDADPDEPQRPRPVAQGAVEE
jgi:hypothetical protein